MLDTFVVSKGTSHAIEVDQARHGLYFPVHDAQGKPTLRVMQFAS